MAKIPDDEKLSVRVSATAKEIRIAPSQRCSDNDGSVKTCYSWRMEVVRLVPKTIGKTKKRALATSRQDLMVLKPVLEWTIRSHEG
jgi:hypothetical protein